jgi:hypothetical protein
MVLGRKASVMTKEKKGPRGGESTIYDSGLLRKTCYFYPDEWEAIRQEAFKRGGASYADIIREAVRAYLRIDDENDGLPSP